MVKVFYTWNDMEKEGCVRLVEKDTGCKPEQNWKMAFYLCFVRMSVRPYLCCVTVLHFFHSSIVLWTQSISSYLYLNVLSWCRRLTCKVISIVGLTIGQNISINKLSID